MIILTIRTDKPEAEITQDPGWLETGIKRLLDGENDTRAMPFYGADAHITLQKK
jgi:hypothetical protein